ncbi:hypothetical protein Tco_1202545 [Tanacetum coccineum]
MSTLVFVDPEISTQADGAQSPRVPVPFPKDPYEAIRHAYLVETDTPESPHTVASPTPLPDSTPPMRYAKDSVDSDTFGVRSTPSDSTAPLSPDHLLTHASHTLVPILRRTARMAVHVLPAMSPNLSASIAEVAAMSDSAFLEDDEEEEDTKEEDEEIEESSDSDSESEGAEDEGPTVKDDDPAAGDEGLAAGDEGLGRRVKSLGLEGDVTVPEDQQRAAPIVETVMGEPLGLGYGALRRQEIALGEGRMPSVFEVDPEDGIAYIDVPTYPPPAPPVQTLPSPEWSLVHFLFLQHLLSFLHLFYHHDTTDRSIAWELSPALFERYDKDTGELFTRSGAVRDEILSHRYQFRSLEHEQERVAVTFRAIWRPVLTLKSWASQTDAQRAALWHAINDT